MQRPPVSFLLACAFLPCRGGAWGYADLILVEGDPTQDVTILTDYENKIDLIMKDGVIYKNALDQ